MLGKSTIKTIYASVDELFDRLKARFLGPHRIDKKIVVSYDPNLSLPGLYESTVKTLGSSPDQGTLNSLVGITESYLDAYREKTKAQVLQSVTNFLNESESRGTDPDWKDVLEGELTDQFGKLQSDLTKIVDSEAQNGRSIGALEGITRANENLGIDDPVVFFVIVRDSHVCDECIRLHMMEDEVTPRLWYMSEVGHGYHKKGEQNPKIRGLHPHCRCALTTMMPGFGFKDGRVSWISPGFSAIEDQRGIKKHDHALFVDELIKADGDVPTAKPPKAPKKTKEPDLPALVAVHNLSESNLHHAHKLGGLAAPSIAIAHKDYPFHNFGDVTLVADQHLVDPAKTPVFDADIYSPRHPKARTDINSKAVKGFSEWIKPHAETLNIEPHEIIQQMSEGPDKILGHYRYRQPLSLAFLHERGQPVDPIMQDSRVDKHLLWAHSPVVSDFFDKNGINKYAEIGSDYHKNLSSVANKAMQGHAQKLSMELNDGKEDKQDTESFLSHWRDSYLDKNGQLTLPAIHKLVSAHNAKGQKQIDHHATGDLADTTIKNSGLEKDFHKWAHDKLSVLDGGQYIPKHIDTINGPQQRKIPYNLQNILKEMTKTIRQGEGFNYGLGSVRAAGARKFRNLDQIKAARDKLVSPEQFAHHKEAMDLRFEELLGEVRDYHNAPDSFHVRDAFGEALSESYKRGKYLFKELQNSGFSDIPSDLHRKIADFSRDLVNMPTEYFEAKPQRIVNVNEFKGAVVPHDVSQETLDALKEHGIENIERYPREDHSARWDAVRRLSQAKQLMLSEGVW